MVGLISDINYITTQSFKQSGDLVYLVGETKPEFGGSELQKLLNGEISGKAPSIDLIVEKKRQSQLLKAIHAGVIASAHDLAEGGLAVALAECVMEGKVGAEVKITGEDTVALFAESQSRFLVSVPKEKKEQFERIVDDAINIGEVTVQTGLKIQNESQDLVIQVSVDELQTAWKGAIPCLLK